MSSYSVTFSTDLPDDVFEPGEVKPTRPLRKPATNGTAAPATATATGPKKRNAPTEVCRVMIAGF